MRYGFRVQGRVQGVGYRMFARDEAQGLGLRGWVRNALDGAVEGEVEGEPTALECFRLQLQRGPRWGEVRSLEWCGLDEGEASRSESLPHPFEIRR